MQAKKNVADAMEGAHLLSLSKLSVSKDLLEPILDASITKHMDFFFLF